jgi:hypothetical protein
MYKLLKRKPDDLTLSADPFNDRHSRGNEFPYWQGTVVGIDITLDTTEGFTRLLGLIGEIYEEAVKERRRARKNIQPKFI